MPSNVSPGPSPYIGWKWPNPPTPSQPNSSASCTRRTSSSHVMRCCATSSPNRMDRDTATDVADPATPAGSGGADGFDQRGPDRVVGEVGRELPRLAAIGDHR